jgi:hypothetical protein
MKYRMYGMTNYQMTGIQKGIQFGHAVVEYSLLYHNQPDYAQWSTNDKTFIILDGGTTNINETRLGTLNKAADYVEKELNIPIARFHEPDLGDQLTAVVFIVDERVFNKKDYPEFSDWLMSSKYADLIRTELGITIDTIAENIKKSTNKQDQKAYQECVKLVGGEKIVFLRDFLKNFRLA